MRPGAKVMFGIATFLGLVALIYILSTSWVQDDAYLYGTEWAGGVAIVLAFGLAIMLAAYIQFVDTKIDLLPEDFEEAETEDGAGTLGFFSPGSIWPFAMAMAILVFGYGIVFQFYWMIALGLLLLVWAAAMLSLQYGLPKEKH